MCEHKRMCEHKQGCMWAARCGQQAEHEEQHRAVGTRSSSAAWGQHDAQHVRGDATQDACERTRQHTRASVA
jgi:hypothetical protein